MTSQHFAVILLVALVVIVGLAFAFFLSMGAPRYGAALLIAEAPFMFLLFMIARSTQ